MQTGETEQKHFSLDWRFSIWGALFHISEIRNIPREYRLVPSIKGTDCSSQPLGLTSIPLGCTLVFKQNINPGHLALLSFKLVPKYSWNKNTLRFGPSWTAFGFIPAAMIGSDNTSEDAGNGTTYRGTGRSLVYYASKARWSYIPGAVLEYERKTGDYRAWFAGIHLENYRLDIQRGVDSWDALTTRDHKSFAKILVVAPVIGKRYGSGTFFFGWSRAFAKLNTQAAGADMRFGAGGPVLGLSFDFSLIKKL
ncbi:MAG: hypothetical protein HYX21_03095 [Candidatus Yanofskybacteria bacterium]|nr:hypothetical protein [Candidatus Yanofskybacteria bacterium]